MSFWLATLNPGRKVRRGRRRKLTAWQRAVKKHGGVMQAVRAMRKGKRKRVRSRSRRRRNPFLTAGGAAGAKVLMNARRRPRRRRKIRTRRSAVLRGSPRSRSRRASSRRSKMARKTRRRRHRMPSRGRGGRFVSRRTRGRRRRTRRNPVLPISWNPRRRRRRSRRNPLFRSRRTGKFRGRPPGRRLHRRRRSPRYWHNAFQANPKRRRSRRRYRRNSVLPISWNPGGLLSLRGSGPVGSVLGRVTKFVDVKFWTEDGIPAATGFFASKAGGALVMEGINKLASTVGFSIPSVAQPYAKMAADAVAGAGLAWLADRFVGKRQGDMVWMGTVVNVAYSMLKALLGDTEIGRKIGLSGLGDDLTARMKDAIAARVAANLRGLNGMGAYLTQNDLRPQMGLNEYVTENALRMRATYAPTPGASLKDYDPTNQENSF